MRLLDELFLAAVSISVVVLAVAVVVSSRNLWSILIIAGLCDYYSRSNYCRAIAGYGLWDGRGEGGRV